MAFSLTDPTGVTSGLSGILSVIGVGLSIEGTMKATAAAQQEYNIQGQIAGYEQQENAQRYEQMILTTQRQQMENLRNTQRARAQGVAAAVNQGAQYGSGLPGGQAQASAQGATNALGFQQNLQIGTNIFGIDTNISASRQQLATVGSQLASAQGLQAIGGAIAGASGPAGNVGGSIFNFLPKPS